MICFAIIWNRLIQIPLSFIHFFQSIAAVRPPAEDDPIQLLPQIGIRGEFLNIKFERSVFMISFIINFVPWMIKFFCNKLLFMIDFIASLKIVI